MWFVQFSCRLDEMSWFQFVNPLTLLSKRLSLPFGIYNEIFTFLVYLLDSHIVNRWNTM